MLEYYKENEIKAIFLKLQKILIKSKEYSLFAQFFNDMASVYLFKELFTQGLQLSVKYLCP